MTPEQHARCRAFLSDKRNELTSAKATLARLEAEIETFERTGTLRGGDKPGYALAGYGPREGSRMWRAHEALRNARRPLTITEIAEAIGVETHPRAINSLRTGIYKHLAAGTTFIRSGRAHFAAREQQRQGAAKH